MVLGPVRASTMLAMTEHAAPAPTDVDLDLLVRSSESFTPAEIEHAARTASQSSFERAVYGGSTDEGPTTDDYVAALRGARPSVDASVRASFEADVRDLARF